MIRSLVAIGHGRTKSQKMQPLLAVPFSNNMIRLTEYLFASPYLDLSLFNIGVRVISASRESEF